MYHKTALGELVHEENKNLTDLTFIESLPLIVLCIMTIGFGLYPKMVTVFFESFVNGFLSNGL